MTEETTTKSKPKLYQDTIHGFIIEASSKSTAWMLIRAKCHNGNLEIPTLDKIILKNDNQ